MKRMIIMLLLFSHFSTFSQVSKADSPAITPFKNSAIQEVEPQNDGLSIPFYSKREFLFGISVLIALLLIIPLLIWIIRKKNMADDLSVKLLLTSVVILSTLFLVVAGFDDKSIAPAFGLFGAIIGYIFGRSDSKTS